MPCDTIKDVQSMYRTVEDQLNIDIIGTAWGHWANEHMHSPGLHFHRVAPHALHDQHHCNIFVSSWGLSNEVCLHLSEEGYATTLWKSSVGLLDKPLATSSGKSVYTSGPPSTSGEGAGMVLTCQELL
jgi:hypothetical protein